MKKEDSLSLTRQVVISLRMLRTAWRIRAGAMGMFFVGVLLEISGFVVSLYATSRLGALLAAFITSGETAGIWFWLWVDIASGAIIAFGFFLMSYTRQLLYFAYVRWSINTFLQTLCRLDLPDYYDEDVRNQINKISSGYIWQLPNLSDANLDLLYGILRFISITVIVSQITWWLVPVIALFLIPSLLAERRLALLKWFVWDAKGDQQHVFWGLNWILRQAKGQMELRSSQATQYVLNMIDHMNKDFYNEQEKRYRHASRFVISTKILESGGMAVGLIVVLRQFLARTISLDRYFFLSGGLLRIGGALNNIGSLGIAGGCHKI
jgi:hypothetical protein